MTFDGAIKALSLDALKNVKDGYVIGLGSGRAATALVKSLSKYIKTKKISVKCVPTSMQIKLIATMQLSCLTRSFQKILGPHMRHINITFYGKYIILKKIHRFPTVMP